MSLFPSSITQAAQAVPVVAPTPAALATGLDPVMFDLSSALTAIAPPPPGLLAPELPHQTAARVAANHALASFGCAVIGDDMGMGKTRVALALIAERIANGGYGVVFAPPVTQAGYMGDMKAAFPGLRFHHIKGIKADFASLPIADVYWISDHSQTMQAWTTRTVTYTDRDGHEKTRLEANAFIRAAKIVVRDEIHRDKGSNGKATTGRAKVMMALGEALRAQGTPLVGMTGTLLTNRVVESMVPLSYLGGENLLLALTPGAHKGSGFLWRYCAPVEKWAKGRKFTVFGTDFTRAAELHSNLRSTVYVRREKSDLGDLLPNSGIVVVPIALNGMLRRYNELANDFLGTVMRNEGPKAYFAKAKMEAAQRMFALWQEAGNAKAHATVDYVQQLVDQGRKVVVFYHHTRAWETIGVALGSKGIRYCTINGKVTGDRRMTTINDFQNQDSDTMVCLAQIGAAGVGVTLTAAADAVFAQLPWSAGDFKQAMDRILRTDSISMQRAIDGEAITWHILQACQEDGTPTIDGHLFGVLQEKSAICDAVNAGRPVTIDEDTLTESLLQAWYPSAQAQYRP